MKLHQNNKIKHDQNISIKLGPIGAWKNKYETLKNFEFYGN